MADEASDAGSGDNACEGDGGAGFGEARGKKRGDVRAGFPRVHADENMGLGIFAPQIGAERAPGRVERGVIERGSSGNTPDSVSAEEFFGHADREADLREDDLKKV